MTSGADRRDAAAHRRDAPRFCPRCAASVTLTTEFWEADDRRFYCWCAACSWAGEIIPAVGDGVVGHERAH